jgi:hypothetical protein
VIALARLRELREVVAVVVASGHIGALPILARFEAEIASAEQAAIAVDRARQVAQASRFKPTRGGGRAP